MEEEEEEEARPLDFLSFCLSFVRHRSVMFCCLLLCLFVFFFPPSTSLANVDPSDRVKDASDASVSHDFYIITPILRSRRLALYNQGLKIRGFAMIRLQNCLNASPSNPSTNPSLTSVISQKFAVDRRRRLSLSLCVSLCLCLLSSPFLLLCSPRQTESLVMFSLQTGPQPTRRARAVTTASLPVTSATPIHS